ncbi:DUF5797 family protein [Halorarius halobius]|uniref:DUF5797 family protein n=1 Tax=Halorarius halobius TaxID=2962671 RepID=UPI0020CECB75|nr:DUF5797 family protein [Halorarius halobius]
MSELSEEAKARLADVVALQPTKNGELQERWGMDSGSEVHQFLESELKPYYYRDENSLIRATEEAAGLVDVEPGVESDADADGPRVVRVPELQRAIVEVLAAHDEDSESVVSVLHKLRDEGFDPDVDDVRSGLRSLANKGVVTTVRRTVPTFKLAVAREDIEVELLEPSSA